LRQRAHDSLPIKATLIYGNRTDVIVFKEELDGYAASNPSFTVHYVVGAPLSVAKITELVPGINQSLVYLSGPTIMASALSDELEVAGLPATQLKQDFYPSYSQQNY
jgi:ferredoxin-NADP reductase